MININKTTVWGWESAIRGMRNPLKSWGLSDTNWLKYYSTNNNMQHNFIGEKDLSLMKRLSKAGNDHAKFLRMIHVQCDITAPLYWWKEFDTYKVGTVSNSTSTMHRIHAKEFVFDDFSHEHLIIGDGTGVLRNVVNALNDFRNLYLETNNKEYWWQMIQILPSSYNQLRTIDLNYQVLKSMYWARKDHKLDEWHDFCDWCLTLPYFKDICVDICVDMVSKQSVQDMLDNAQIISDESGEHSGYCTEDIDLEALSTITIKK